MDLETYKRKLLEEDERKNLAELQKEYSGKETPNYADMSLREELETKFDLKELNDLQQKYGEQQTQTTSTPYNQPSAPQQPNPQPSTWNNALRKTEQLATGALDGFSLGWFDELEGLISAAGYGLASLKPEWNKTNESVWNAMKRGYVNGRDNRRQVLAQGLQENPASTTLAQMAGAVSSPINLFRYSKATPLRIKNILNKKNAITNGVIYGFGSGQDDWPNYAQQIGIGLTGNLMGNLSAIKHFGPAANPLTRNIFSAISGQGTDYLVDGIKNWYHYYTNNN